MTYTPKAWLNFPTKTTPINSTALRALEQRVASYATSEAVSPGTDGYESFRVKQRALGANMSVDIGLPGVLQQAWVRDAAIGIYRYEYNGAQLNVAIGAADGTNPRIDRVVATAPASIDSIVPQIVVLAGTPTGGATLDNLSGAQAIPVGYTLLADVLVGAGVVTILTANIRERRNVGGSLGDSGIQPYGSVQSTAPATRDEIALIPHTSLVIAAQTFTPTTHDNMQGSYMAYLTRRIVGATRIRWKFAQGATPATSNFNAAIVDQSGRLIIAQGATAFTGGANAIVNAAGVITATTFEPGWYEVWFGVAALTAASALSFTGVQGNISVTAPGSPFANIKSHSAAGGTTFPASNTLAAYTDVAAQAAAANNLPIPMVSLSVG